MRRGDANIGNDAAANPAAVRLRESLGFTPLGVVPGAFRHPTSGPVGLRIMWLDSHPE